MNLLLLSLSPSLTLNSLTYQLILGIIKTNRLIDTSYCLKFLSLFKTDLMSIMTLCKVNMFSIGKESTLILGK